jgi:6-phosphogluconolactonase (cycloisomerase 2 family)
VDSLAGTIDGYTLSASATTFQATANYTAPAIIASDAGAGMVVVQKQFLYAVQAKDGLIYGWSISSTGTLTPLTGFPVSVALSGTVPTIYRQVTVTTNPAGTLLFIAQTLSSQIQVYQIAPPGSTTPTPGTLTPVTGSPFSTGAEPVNLGMDGLGKYLYVTETPNFTTHTAAQVAAYAITGTGAATTLTAVPGSPFAFNMWQVQGDSSGNYLIGISGNSQSLSATDDDNVYVFGIANTGAITPVVGSPFKTTYSPFNLTVNPVGEFLYTFSLTGVGTGNNATEGYVINPASGALTAVTGSPFLTLFMGENGQFDQTGTYLFSPNGDVGALTSVQLAAFVTANTGALTQPFSNVTLSTGGYWAVTEPQ